MNGKDITNNFQIDNKCGDYTPLIKLNSESMRSINLPQCLINDGLVKENNDPNEHKGSNYNNNEMDVK